MLEHFSPQEALEIIEKERVTITPMVPAQAAMVIRHPDFEKYDISSLRVVLTMGAPLPYKVAVDVEKKLGCPIIQNYGSIDCAAACMGAIDDPIEVRLSTVGKPYAGAEVKLVGDRGEEVDYGEAGEIFIRGPAAVSGYYKDPEATWQIWSRDGWYRTGDLGRFDEEGHLIIVGRKKEMIIRGGQNIYPVEIEDLLMTHPGVANIAIVKMPDPIMGERACAYVIPEGGQEFTFDEMVSFLKEKGVTPYKFPERLEVVNAFPMVAEGQKIDRKALEKDIEEKLKAQGQG
jgi:non-ribosomal peptide synthetase component E (peptide arylation enzyme)